MPSFLSIGHRGAAGYEPENTLRSIQRALDLGAHAIEIDVRLSSDGELVVFHDSNLKRIARTPGTIFRKSLAELQQIDAGKGERIPTLREVLDLIGGRVWLNIELKAKGTAHAVAREIARVVEEGKGGWSYDKIVVSSFDRRELARVLDCHEPGVPPPIRIGLLLARKPISLARLAARLRATSVHLSQRLATPGMIKRAHEAGLRVFVFTVNDPAEITRLRQLGADGVFTDFPDRAVAATLENANPQ